jgi:hypothetical protein
MSATIAPARLGIAGVNTRTLHTATLRIGGAQEGCDKQHQSIELTASMTPGARLGDRAAAGCWAHAAYLLDYSYLVCPDRSTGRLHWRAGFAGLYGPGNRYLPMYLDSAAYRTAAGTAPPWTSYARYCQALELVRPDGAMAPDVLDDQDGSRDGYERLRGDGFGELVIPVWQVRPAWESTLDATANGLLATRDPTLRNYADRAPVVAIGGLVRGPCPRAERHLYLAELVRAFPDTHIWALGQSSAVVINGLGQLGLLNRVSTDGAWWIHHSCTEQLAVVQGGLLRNLRLTHTGAETFLTLPELMAANLRALLAAYAGLWTFPPPAEVPTDLRDPEVRLELRRRLAATQLELFGPTLTV